jgi:hypothetical protein
LSAISVSLDPFPIHGSNLAFGYWVILNLPERCDQFASCCKRPAMAKGDIKADKGSIVGSAGEYFVMAELLKRGWLAGLTPRGAPDLDIVAPKEDKTIHVRVKTKTADSRLFRGNRLRDGKVFRAPLRESDFCVLVDIGGAAPEYYVIPTG